MLLLAANEHQLNKRFFNQTEVRYKYIQHWPTTTSVRGTEAQFGRIKLAVTALGTAVNRNCCSALAAVLANCRVTVQRTPWRHPKRRSNRSVWTQRGPTHTAQPYCTRTSAFRWSITSTKTASRSFRYVTLSLQNGVLRNRGDTGVTSASHYQGAANHSANGELTTRPCPPLDQSQATEHPRAWTVNKMSRKWTSEVIQVSC